MQRDFQRGYKACEECRKRKTRCDLGGSGQDLFAFTGPPCAYCRRTRRECIFRDERNTRKRQRLDLPTISPPSEDGEAETQSLSMAFDTQLPFSNANKGSSETSPAAKVFGPTGGDSAQFHVVGPGQDDRRATSSTIPSISPRSTQLDSWQRSGVRKTAASDQRSSAGGNDPVHLSSVSSRLADQSASPSTISQHQSSAVSDLFRRTVISKGGDCIDILSEGAANAERVPTDSPDYAATHLAAPPGDPSFGSNPVALSPSPIRSPIKMSTTDAETLSVWTCFKFVKTRLLTAEEALTYIDAFFLNLSSKSPVLDDHFADHRNHHRLLFDEPFLCSTIMMISSRYHVLPGTASASRGHFIHDQLWFHVQGLIQQIMLGQGESAGHRLRTLGSIEALLLMSEWYARTVLFQGSITVCDRTFTSDTSEATAEIGNEDLVEPSRRFDRMSWMLLGAAQTLAHELGILQDIPEQQLSNKASTMSVRSARVRDLLFIYVTLLAARLGFRSMISLTFNPVFLRRATSPPNGILSAWIELIKLTKTIHTSMFSTKSITRDLLQSGNYLELLEHFEPLLLQWQRKHLGGSSFDYSGAAVESPLDDLLLTEYLYVRMYSYSPALQALTLRVLSYGSSESSLPATANTSMNLDELADQPEYRFICHVIQDAQQIVKRAITLAQSALLRYYPARTFQRLISACVFLLKANLLGVQHIRSPSNISAEEVVDLLRQSVWALKASAVDDAHLATYYALLLERQLNRHSVGSALQPHTDSSTTGRNSGMPRRERNGEGAADWHATLSDPLDDIDLFADFTIFGELGFATDASSFDI